MALSISNAAFGNEGDSPPSEAANWTDSNVALINHDIITDDDASDAILPWYSPGNRGASYDHIIRQVFEWWIALESYGDEPYAPYIIHMIYDAGGGGDGTGGDQLAMALSSWRELYAYWGDSRIKNDMIFIADTYLANSLSPSGDEWPYLPYPYQRSEYATWNGDYLAGTYYTQPDKAGSFAYEILQLYKMTNDSDYLTAAVNIANTLASKTIVGDDSNSPMPFKVRTTDSTINMAYCANWAETLELWEELAAMGQGNDYSTAKSRIIAWWKAYPVQDFDYGPFFEDIGSYSDAACVGLKMARYIMEHRADWGASWDEDARAILDEIVTTYGNTEWSTYGVRVTNEQTYWLIQGQSHTAHDASVELLYSELTGETDEVANAIRQLSWATYPVDNDGANHYPDGTYNYIWMTDGYGDYVRYFIRSMASAPYLAPSNQDHILRSSDVVKSVTYGTGTITYETYAASREKLRVTTFTPTSVTVGGVALIRKHNVSDLDDGIGWTYDAYGGLDTEMNIRHGTGEVVIS